MKKTLLAAFCLVVILSLMSCRKLPDYHEVSIYDDCEWQNEKIAVFRAEYPRFNGEIYQSLNSVIEKETEEWRQVYDEICEKAKSECEKSSEFAKLGCYVTVDYVVSSQNGETAVTFDVHYFGGGNSEPHYTKTFTYDEQNNMIYETYSETTRVYE